MAVIFALAIPALAVISLGAIELSTLSRDKQALQGLADEAAIAAANEMALSSADSVVARVQSSVLARTAEIPHLFNVEVTAAPVQTGEEGVGGMTVRISSRRPSFFGNLLPPNGFHIAVSATAVSMSKQPLCVIGISETVQNGINVDRGEITATGCVVHSNYDVRVNTSSVIAAAAVQAAGAVTGASTANSRPSAGAIEDPFASLVTGPADWNACNAEAKKADKDGEILTLNPGVHCDHFDIDKTAILRLRPGVHYFRDKLQMKESSRLETEDGATLVFGRNFTLALDSNDVRWNLLGGKTGSLSGFVLVVDRARTADVTLKGRTLERLEGVVYSPTATLKVDGSGEAADASAWTVVVGKELRLTNQAHMVINSDYAGSSVPVPSGVGNKTSSGGMTRLSH